MISEKEELLEWRKRAAAQPAGRVVLDLEADSLHRYQEKICLIQYADETGSCLIDPLSIEDMGPFYNWLKETEVWMHGADYDMSLFQHAWETLPAMIWDTQTAARLLGFRQFGLAALVEHFYGITLSKSSQKADWARRPLSPTMVTYALNDVNYMLDMADKLTAALREKGRMGWFEEISQTLHGTRPGTPSGRTSGPLAYPGLRKTEQERAGRPAGNVDLARCGSQNMGQARIHGLLQC